MGSWPPLCFARPRGQPGAEFPHPRPTKRGTPAARGMDGPRAFFPSLTSTVRPGLSAVRAEEQVLGPSAFRRFHENIAFKHNNFYR